jgi:uncharacterized membrane protein YeaQ/YmgE (transglycosylase-associated protein family)
MSYSVWLPLVMLAGWAAGEIVGGDEYGRTTDILLGLLGAFVVRFVIENSTASLNHVYLLLFSIWGAAAFSATFRLMIRRRAAKPKLHRTTP